jgi:phosphatidylinositol alpha-mannosyltransferase
MKIAFVLDDTLDSSDGVQQYVLLVSDWLRKKGHDIHYITGHTTRTDIPNIHSMAKNVRVRFNHNRLSVPLPASGKRIHQLLSKEKYDVLHVQMPFNPLLAGKVISRADPRTAIVATYHIAPHSKLVVAASKALGVVQARTVSRLDALISVSHVAQAFAKSTTHQDSVVIPNAIDTKLWRPAKQQPRNTDIAFLGRHVSRKGCIYLLKALNELKTTGKLTDQTVVIAGDGPDRQNLEAYVLSHNLSDYVRFVGYLSEEQKRQLLQTTKLAIYPATGGESFGIVLLEAMAAGAVVIGGDNPGYASVIGQAEGSLVTPQDTATFAERIVSLLEDPKLLEDLGSRQQALLAQYDIDTVGNAILTVYKEVVSQRGAQPNAKR